MLDLISKPLVRRRPMGKIQLVVIISAALVLLFVITLIQQKTFKIPSNKFQLKKTSRLIEFADSLKNSKPDSALIIYNRVIAQISNSEVKQVDSLLLASAHTGIASTYLTTGDYRNAVLHDSIAEVIALKQNDSAVRSKVYLCKGTIYFKQNEFKLAEECYNTAKAFAKKDNDSVLIAKVLSNEAMLYYNQGDVKKTIETFKEALNIGKHVKNETLIANNYLNLAIVYSYQSMNDSIIVFNTHALNLFKKTNDKIGESSCYKNLGAYYYEISDYNNAITNFQLALDLAIEIGDQSNMAKGYHNLSELYARIGDNTRATELLDKSIKIKEKLGDKRSLALGYLAVGNLHYTRNNYTEALGYYKKSLVLFLDKELKGDIGRTYSYIGNALSGLQKNDSAIIYYNKAIEQYKQVENTLGLTNLYINLGDAYRVKRDFNQSEKYFVLALNSKRKLNDEEGITLVYNYLAILYFDQSKSATRDTELSKLQLAEKSALQSYQMAKHLGIKPVMQEVSETLMKTYEKMGKYSNALFYSKEHNALSDSILDKAKIEALTFAEARWNVEKKQNEIENLENKQKYSQQIIKQKEIETQQQKFIIWILVILSLSVGISVLIFSMFVKKRREALYQKQLVKMSALRMQNARNSMSPHFFFNVLASLTGLSGQPERLKEKLRNLSLLLRKVIENIDQTAIPLANELEAVKAYVDLYRERIPEPFVVEYLIDEKTNLQVLVPAMTLQIPVENAIKHGLMPLEGDKKLAISVTGNERCLHITVVDNGIGLKASAGHSTGTGTGLKVLLQTIHLLNTKNLHKIKFTISEKETEDSASPGAVVQIEIPLNFDYTI